MSKKGADLAQSLRNRGFDKSRVSEDNDDHARVGCSQCNALVINGVVCHETGCPNARRKHHAGLGEFSEEEEG